MTTTQNFRKGGNRGLVLCLHEELTQSHANNLYAKWHIDGCVDCKVRKVKCDETRPRCLRCTTRQIPCHYGEPFRSNERVHASTSISSPIPSAVIVKSPAYDLQHLFPSQSLAPIPTPLPPLKPGPSERNWDMELLHHFTTATYLTFARNPSMESTWQIAIPKLAFSNPFLLHGLLAIAACHISHAPNDEADILQYNNLAKQHYNSALSLFRPILSRIEAANATPIVAFSMLVTILSLGMPPEITPEPDQPATGSDYIGQIIDVLQLFKGVRQVLDQSIPFIQDSFLMPILKLDRTHESEELGFEDEVALRSIESRIHSDISSPALQADYLETAKILRECSPRRAENREQQANLMAWAAMIPSSFFEEMKELRPISMAILGFFGTFLHALRDVWWVGDKGRILVESVVQVLGTSRGWDSVVIWAKMKVGIPSDYNLSN